MNNSFSFLLTLISVLLLAACQSESQEVTQQPVVVDEIRTTGNPTIDKLSRDIAANPNDPNLYALRAELFYENEGYDEAISDLKKALTMDSTNADYLHLLADAQLDYFKSKEALETMERTVSLAPQRIQSLLKLSEFQLIMKKYDESLQSLERVLTIDPQSAEGYFMSGMVFKEKGDIPRALNGFQTALENDPDLIDGWIELGILFEKENNPAALQYLDKAVELDSMNVEAHLAKGNYHLKRDQFETAIESYKKITRSDPQFASAYYNIGLCEFALENLAKAHQQFDIAINVDPAYTLAYFYRGLTSKQQGNAQAAKKDFQQALNFDPNFERAKEELKGL